MKSFKVSNFRLFGSEGAEVEFKPLTVLTGPNSAGKSSYIKALILFSKYLQGLLNEHKRDGGYDPMKHYLNFSGSELQLGGFSSVINRAARPGETMSFSLNVFPSVSCYGNYIVTYAFQAEQQSKDNLDRGALKDIFISRGEESILHASVDKDGKLFVDYLHSNILLSDFIAFCKHCLLPYYIQEDYRDYDGTLYYDVCDDNGNWDSHKAAGTPEGKRLAKLQGYDEADFSFAYRVRNLSKDTISTFRSLFSTNLFPSLEKCFEHNLVFYFPILEKFLNKNKEESLTILKEYAGPSYSIGTISPQDKFIKEGLKTIIQDYENSDYESFIDYFRSLEDFVLENENKRGLTITRWGESYNFIIDYLLRIIDVSYDDGGFANRESKETLFSVAYNVLSSWQWREGEREDSEWFHFNNKGTAITALWGKSDDFISRHINEQYQSYSSEHVLFKAFKDYLRILFTDCLIPSDLSRLNYSTSFFTAAKRLHTFDDNTQFVRTVWEYINNRDQLLSIQRNNSDRLPEKDDRYVPNTFLNKWLGKDGFNICNEISIDVPLGLGFSLKLKTNDHEEYLADVGHGITQIVSILLSIESILIENEINDVHRAKKNEYYRRHSNIILGIEEPEISLHPNYQSKLAEMFYDAIINYKYLSDGLSLIVETHSEYLIRKLQAIVSRFTKEEFDNNPFSVYFFKNNGTVYDMVFKETGKFERNFESGFFDEAARLSYDVLKKEEQVILGSSK